MTALEQRKAEIAKELAEKKKAYQEKVELARLEASLKIADTQFKMESITETTNKLKDIELQCQEVVASMPIYSSVTRELRKWNPSRQYGLGNHIQLVSGILSGIMYSTAEHKAQMLEITGLSEDLIEQTVEAFGSTAYFSNNYNEIVPETACDIETLRDNLVLVANILGVDLDTSKVTDTVMRQRFQVARIRAEKAKAELELTTATNQTIKVEE